MAASSPLEELVDLLTLHNITLIEDAACCPASRIGGQACGTVGDIGVWSFDGAKIMTCAEGGMMYVRDPALMQKRQPRLRLGMSSVPGVTSQRADQAWEFDVINGGRKNQISDIAAALERVQLARLPSMLARRRRVHEIYRQRLSSLEWITLPPLTQCERDQFHNWSSTTFSGFANASMIFRSELWCRRFWPTSPPIRIDLLHKGTR
jgi:dTDP-4-amino-4,6-dideoxygalactose transaminase